ncbi:MAG: glycosyltransferase family 2 protein [Jatrophihabitans sp.]|uniref:glycosyltransferase family 2 protein n=1 Tax=Jatrophihabitans sp. TaxID=1932789 RepID=UPI0039111AB5
MTEWPGVSYVIPVLNEAEYVEAAVSSVLAQDYPGPAEVVLALGPSTDGTNEIVAAMQADDTRIHTVENPGTDIPIGLNRAIRASQYPVIVRVDAHTQLPPGYTERAVATLQREHAANVGGIMMAVGRPGLQAAIARAYNSRLGLGGAAYHRSDEPAGEAESAYLGVMRADALADVGYFDESVRRGEDWELNYRLRAAGHRVWLDPELKVTYWPRADWPALVRQFWATGIWRGELVRRLHRRNSLRFFAPPALVAGTAVAVLTGPAALTGVGGPGLAIVAGLSAAAPAAYVALLAAVAVGDKGSIADRARYCWVLATMHYVWGAGFLVGAVRGGRHTVDASRIAPVQPSQPSS